MDAEPRTPTGKRLLQLTNRFGGKGSMRDYLVISPEFLAEQIVDIEHEAEARADTGLDYGTVSAAIENLPPVAPGAVDREIVLGILRAALASGDTGLDAERLAHAMMEVLPEAAIRALPMGLAWAEQIAAEYARLGEGRE